MPNVYMPVKLKRHTTQKPKRTPVSVSQTQNVFYHEKTTNQRKDEDDFTDYNRTKLTLP